MPSETEKAACKRKNKYSSEPEAKQALERSKKRNPGKPLRTYKCPVCFKWHLTSSSKR